MRYIPLPLYIKYICPRISFSPLTHGKIVLFSPAFAVLDMLSPSEDIHTPIPNFHPPWIDMSYIT